MKKFLNILPDLKLSHEMTELFETVECEKVAASRDHSRIKIYIHSDRLIAHKAIRETERAIRSQMFKDQVDVCLVEKYHLSRQYTPARLLEAYTGSLIDELEEEGELSANLFRKAEKTFLEPFVLELKVEENCIAQVKMEKLKHKLEHIFSERFDMPLEIVLGWLPKKKSKYAVYADSAMKEEIAQIVQTYEQAKEDQKDVEKQEVQQREKPAFKKNYVKQRLPEDKDIFYGRNFEGEETEIHEIIDEMGEVVVRGKIIQLETREIRNEKTIVMFAVTDFTDTIKAKVFTKNERLPELLDKLKEGAFIKMKAVAMMDQFEHDIALGSVSGIKTIPDFTEKRMDHSPVKRVELHCHTTMSDMDGVTDVKKLLKTAMGWGHQAMAITDHGVVQAFPDANHCVEGKDFKVIYGMEGYLVDDIKNIVTDSRGQSLDSTFVVFDIETTGFSAVNDRIIEIGAVKVENGMITEKFSEFVNPERPIPFEIEKLTSINDRMVEDAPNISVILPKFMDFCGGSVLVAHNADFDTGFIRHNCEVLGLPYDYTYVDTLGIARSFLEGLKNYKLDTVVEAMGCTLANHHRAVDDAGATADVFVRFLERFKKKNIRDLDELNTYSAMSVDAIKKLKTYHIILLAKNEIGRINLYRLVSLSHLDYYARRPRIPKSVLAKYREGLIIGSACEAGELFRAVVDERPEEEIARIVEFYDYLEIQPTGNNEFMIRDPKMTKVSTVADLQDLNRKIVELGEKFNKPVCATCDVHFLNPEDEVYRRIIMSNKGFGDADLQPPLYLRTTEEMLEEFQYLGAEKAEEVVVTNTNRIADMIDRISPVRPDKCPPVIENSAGILRDICYNRAHELYGEDLPDIVTERLERELNSIIGNGFAVMYIIAQKLVWKSVADGYLVGSRGSVGSSFVAYMAGITEVNSLQAHYLCPKCHYVDFDSDYVKSFSGRSGCDMEDRVCPVCGEPLMKEGHDIPFETFLGFKGNKEPDIDLNFSGDYQSKAHAYTEVIFGKGKTFRAGTVGTLADKTAYGYAMHYYEEHEQHKRSCELERISSGCVGVRRTTGQHPGGIIVVPHGEEIYSFTPVQHPANDQTTKIITTHFDYHSIDHNLLKLDILGHDDPTVMKFLMDNVHANPDDFPFSTVDGIPYYDEKVISLFASKDALELKGEDVDTLSSGTIGIPEFGTQFVRGMLETIKPNSISQIIKVSGLSHGTDVWMKNAEDLVKGTNPDYPKIKFNEVIGCRDDIMIYLIAIGVSAANAFKIMEGVRKGKGLTAEQEELMIKHNVPAWFIDSCKKIKYLFPKAHAAAYVIMALRIAWFKVYRPIYYYAAYFSKRAKEFDPEAFALGKNALTNRINEIERKIRDHQEVTNKEVDLLDELKIALEMVLRGYKFRQIDVNISDATNLVIAPDKKSLYLPFIAVDSLGETVAQSIVEARKKRAFSSKKDFEMRTSINKKQYANLVKLEAFGDLVDDDTTLL